MDCGDRHGAPSHGGGRSVNRGHAAHSRRRQHARRCVSIGLGFSISVQVGGPCGLALQIRAGQDSPGNESRMMADLGGPLRVRHAAEAKKKQPLTSGPPLDPVGCGSVIFPQDFIAVSAITSALSRILDPVAWLETADQVRRHEMSASLAAPPSKPCRGSGQNEAAPAWPAELPPPTMKDVAAVRTAWLRWRPPRHKQPAPKKTLSSFGRAEPSVGTRPGGQDRGARDNLRTVRPGWPIHFPGIELAAHPLTVQRISAPNEHACRAARSARSAPLMPPGEEAEVVNSRFLGGAQGLPRRPRSVSNSRPSSASPSAVKRRPLSPAGRHRRSPDRTRSARVAEPAPILGDLPHARFSKPRPIPGETGKPEARINRGTDCASCAPPRRWSVDPAERHVVRCRKNRECICRQGKPQPSSSVRDRRVGADAGFLRSSFARWDIHPPHAVAQLGSSWPATNIRRIATAGSSPTAVMRRATA